MRKILYITILIITIFTSCSKKSLNIISNDSLYEKGLEYTNVSTLVYKDEVKAIINTTYLNPTNPTQYDDDFHQVLFGIYISNDNTNQALKDKNYSLSLNNITQYNKIILTNDDKLFHKIPLKNPYSTYYIVRFKKDLSDTINIKLTHKIFGSTTISYKRF
jgi:hypothetical protein